MQRQQTMAIGQIMQFSGAGLDKYDAVRRELGWEGDKGKPEGIVAHAAGSTTDGFCVTEWWSSQGAWDKFFADRLRPAFEKVGGIPQPQVTTFEVHASYPAS
jgi:hypothetical protein